MNPKKVIHTWLLLLLYLSSKAQSPKADSLTASLAGRQQDSNYVKTLNLLSEELADKNAGRSLEYAVQALAISKQRAYTRGIGHALNNIGWAYYRKGDYSKGFENALQALHINDSLQYLPQLAISYRNVGAIYNSQTRYRESIEYFQKELALHRQLKNEKGIGRALNNIAFSASRARFRDTALYYAQEGLAHNTRLQDKYLIAHALRTLGDVFMNDKAVGRAIDYFTASLASAREAKSNFIIETSLYRLGKAYQFKKDWRTSISYFEKAILVARELGAKAEQATVYKLMSESFARLADYKKAYTAQNEFVKLNDSIYEERSRARLAQMQVQFETEKKQAEINLLKKDDEIQKQKISDHRLYTILLLAVVGLVMALLFVSWRRSQFRQQANKLLTEQKQALEEASYQKDRIFSILSHDLRLPIASLSGVLQLMEKQGLSDQAFDKIKHALVKQVHSLNTTLDNLLLWSRSQMEGVKNVHKTDCLLYDVIEANRNLLQSVAHQKKIMISNEVPQALSAFVDKHHMDIVIRNVLLNALKFTEEGGYINLKASEEKATVTLHIADTGVGMSAEQIGKLFKLNTHFTTLGTRNEKGAGLGLLLCKEFIAANHGILTVTSETGNGTVFSINLPKKHHEQEA